MLLRERPAIHPLSLLASTIFIGQLLLIPFTIVEYRSGATVTLDLATLATVGYVAVFPAILAYVCFNRGVELVGSNRTAPFFHLVPVFSSLAAIGFLGEAAGLHHIVGWLLILAGIAGTQIFSARNRRDATMD